MLENQEWKYDQIPEIMDGKNIADFVDKDILQKLDELEKEEEMRKNTKMNELELEEDYEDEDPELLEAKKEITSKRAILKLKRKLKKNTRIHLHEPELEEVKENLQEKGIDTQNIENRVKQNNLKRKKKLNQLQMEIEEDLNDQNQKEDGDDDLIQDEEEQTQKAINKKVKDKKKSMSRSRSKGFKVVKTAQEQVNRPSADPRPRRASLLCSRSPAFGLPGKLAG